MYMYYDHGYEVGSMSLAIMTESTDDWRLFSWLNMIQLTRLPLLDAKWQQRCKDNDWKLLQKFTGLSLPQRIIVSDPYNLSCQPIKISIQPKKVLPKDEHKISATWEKIAGTKESDEASVHLLITTDAPIEEWYCVGWRIVDACWELRLVGRSPYSLYSIMLGRKWGSWDRLQREARDRLQREQQNSFYTVFFGTFDRFYLVQLTFLEKRTSGTKDQKTSTGTSYSEKSSNPADLTGASGPLEIWRGPGKSSNRL